ncbi:MAG: glycosyltransferase [Burkholderiaceae bacterium]
MRIVLIGDGESPHLLKWARALAQVEGVQVWAVSSRGFAAGFDAWVGLERCLALGHRSAHAGGNLSVLLSLPRLGAWLRDVDAQWLHAHYLTSHGTLAWIAKRVWRLRGRLVGSAWGSDVLVTPQRNAVYRWLTRRVLRACALSTSDSAHMAQQMRELGSAEVMIFPFGLDALPELAPSKQAWLFFANRGLEPLYQPLRVLQLFAQIARQRPEARLVVANRGSQQEALRAAALEMGLSVGTLRQGQQVEFIGLLDADAQACWYARAQWYISLPASDSVAVSLLEAMAHGCIPLLSDLPANRELVRDGDNGLIVPASQQAPPPAALEALLGKAEQVARANRAWVENHGLFAPAVARFVARLRELDLRSAA